MYEREKTRDKEKSLCRAAVRAVIQRHPNTGGTSTFTAPRLCSEHQPLSQGLQMLSHITAQRGSFSPGRWFLCPLNVKATLLWSITLCKIISRQLWDSFVRKKGKKKSSTVSLKVQMRKPGKRNPSYRDSFVPPRSWNESKKCWLSQKHPGLKLQTITWNLIHPLEAELALHFPIFSVSLLGVLHVFGWWQGIARHLQSWSTQNTLLLSTLN